MRVLPALAILGTAYAAEQTTDGLVQVTFIQRQQTSNVASVLLRRAPALRGALRRALLAR